MRVVFLYILLLFTLTAVSQNANPDRKRTRHWVFGDSNWIEWTDTGAFQHPYSKAAKTEQMAVFTDTAGNLQLYFDSKNIYDSSHNIINGGAFNNGDWSAYRGGIFIPYPNNDSLCYLFYTTLNTSLNYALINWKSKIVLDKYQLLATKVIEGLAATIHHNNNYYWLVAASRTSDNLLFFLITDNGIIPCPFLQYNANSYIGKTGQCGALFSVNGNLVINHNLDNKKLQIAKFNTFNAALSSQIIRIVDEPNLVISPEISENEKYIYVNAISAGKLWQYRLSDWKANLIDDLGQKPFRYSFGLYRLSKNELVSGFYGSQVSTDTNALTLITNANDSFVSSNYNHDWLKTKHRIKYSPPNFPSNYFREFRTDFSYIVNCQKAQLQLRAIYDKSATSYIWKVTLPKGAVTILSGASISLPIKEAGNWTVQLIVKYGNSADTIIKTIPIFSPFAVAALGPDIPVCADTVNLTLSIPQHAFCIQWDNKGSMFNRSVDTFGTFTLKFYDSNFCVYNDTIVVFKTTKLPLPVLQQSVKDSLNIENYNASQFLGFVFMLNGKTDTSSVPHYKLNDTGKLAVYVYSKTGCTSDTTHILIKSLHIDNFNKQNIKLFPNPTQNSATFLPRDTYTYKVYTPQGKMVLCGSGTALDTDRLAAGIFFVEITNKSTTTQTIKLIKTL